METENHSYREEPNLSEEALNSAEEIYSSEILNSAGNLYSSHFRETLKNDESSNSWFSSDKIFSFIFEFADFFFPRFCVACKTKLTPEERVCCIDCFNKLIPVPIPRCEICGAHISKAAHGKYCAKCPERPVNFDFAASVFYYGKIANHILKAIKYSGRKDAGELSGKIMISFLNKEFGKQSFDYIVPVPLHHIRYFRRGYNQAELLANQISQYSGLPVLNNALVRKKATIKQSMVPYDTRKDNVKGAFAVVDNSAVSGKNILLIDDIMTTGSTINECAGELKKAGAKKITAFTFARA